MGWVWALSEVTGWVWALSEGTGWVWALSEGTGWVRALSEVKKKWRSGADMDDSAGLPFCEG